MENCLAINRTNMSSVVYIDKFTTLHLWSNGPTQNEFDYTRSLEELPSLHLGGFSSSAYLAMQRKILQQHPEVSPSVWDIHFGGRQFVHKGLWKFDRSKFIPLVKASTARSLFLETLIFPYTGDFFSATRKYLKCLIQFTLKSAEIYAAAKISLKIRSMINTLTPRILFFADGPASSWSRDCRFNLEAILKQLKQIR